MVDETGYEGKAISFGQGRMTGGYICENCFPRECDADTLRCGGPALHFKLEGDLFDCTVEAKTVGPLGRTIVWI